MPKRNEPDGSPFHFQGFDSPNTTPVPDVLFDLLAPELTEAELRVLLYVIRRTYGFKKRIDDISLKQLVVGITTRDGRVLDHGAGVAKSAASRAVKGLVEKGIITVTRNRSPEKGDEPTTYALRVTGGQAHAEHGDARGPVFSTRTRGGPPREHTRALQENPQETVRQETDGQSFEFRTVAHPDGVSDDGATASVAAAAEAQDAGGHPPGFRRLRDVVARIRQQPRGPRRARRAPHTQPAGARGGRDEPSRATRLAAEPAAGDATAGLLEEREIVAAYLSDWAAVELGDEAPLSSSVTRALRILRGSGLPNERWADRLYAARSTTKEHSAQITKKPTPGGKGGAARNRMPYFLAVLASLCIPRADESTPAARSEQPG